MSTHITAGDKVCCIDDGWNRQANPLVHMLLQSVQPAPPTKDQVYCVREVYTNHVGTPSLRLVGIISPSVPVFGELGWRADNFRRIWTNDAEIRATVVKSVPQTMDLKDE
jgi:hypothetical protein